LKNKFPLFFRLLIFHQGGSRSALSSSSGDGTSRSSDLFINEEETTKESFRYRNLSQTIMAAEADGNSNVATPPQEHLRIEQYDSPAQQNQNPSDSAVTSDNMHISPILPQRIGFEPSPALSVSGENHRAAHSQGPAAHSSKKPAASSAKAAGVRKRPSQKAKAAEMVRQQQEETEEMVAIMIQQQEQMMVLFMLGAVAIVRQQRQQSSCGIM
jgi:hypothetical protein